MRSVDRLFEGAFSFKNRCGRVITIATADIPNRPFAQMRTLMRNAKVKNEVATARD